MTVLVQPGRPGLLDWTVQRDNEGHRDYEAIFLVEQESVEDGPNMALFADGLPNTGDVWDFGNDYDPWAFCQPETRVSRHQAIEGHRHLYWQVAKKFSTRPLKRCQDQSIENPLDEPPQISGSFTSYMKEAEKDRNGKHILSSSLEKITGLERDIKMPTVVISMNSLSLDLATVTQVISSYPLNDSAMWGVAARCVKLTNFSWERRLYGTCTFYYNRRFEFEIKFDTHDLTDVADAGFKVYKGSGSTSNPANYEVYKDDKGENTQTPILLNGSGSINPDPVGSPVFLPTIELYGQSNLLLLGIPSSL